MIPFTVAQTGDKTTRSVRGEALEDEDKNGATTIYVLDTTLSLEEWRNLRDGVEEAIQRLTT